MNNTRVRFSRLIVALALLAQLSFVSASSLAGQNTNSSTTTTTTTTTENETGRMGHHHRRCRAKCQRAYRLCTHGTAPSNVARCRERLRRCLRHCG